MLEFLVLAELIREDDITFEEYCELIDKYKKIRLEFLNEQLPLTNIKNPVTD